MFLTQLQLRNWRAYRNASFSFPPPDKSGRRNVILVGAQNGYGKTSFLIALYLGLFGREAMSLIEGFTENLVSEDKLLSYQRLIEGILHRPAKNQEDAHCSVVLTFLVDGSPIEITRRWNFKSGGRVRDLNHADGEEVFIESNGRKKAIASWTEANNRIEELLFPCNVMSCLFFDGEQAQKRVEAAGGRALFDAVKTLYGTGLLEQLSESLKTFITNERNALAKSVGAVDADDLERKRQELDMRRDQLASLQRDLTTTRAKRDEADARRIAVEHDLYALVGDKASDIQQYSDAVVALQNEQNQLQQSLVGQIADAALPLAVSRTHRRLTAALDAETIRERWLVLKDEASKKAGLIVDDVLPKGRKIDVDPPLTEGQASKLRVDLEKALERLWTPPPDGCAGESIFPFLPQNDRASVIALLTRMPSDITTKLSSTALTLQSVSVRLAETKVRFARTRDIQPQLEKLKADLQTALDTRQRLNGEVAGLEHRERADQQQLTDLRAAIGQMESRTKASNPVQAKLEVAQRLRTLSDDANDRLVPLCKEALEGRCTVHFRAMISGEYGKFKARFEAQQEPWLEGPNGQLVLVSSMSGAQKRAFGLAFTLAVADVAGTDAPIVIDTPVGNMDSAYRGRVLKYVADAAPGQVIFLSHDEEIYGPYVDGLKSKILQKNLVRFEQVEDGAGVSTVMEGQYF